MASHGGVHLSPMGALLPMCALGRGGSVEEESSPWRMRSSNSGSQRE